MTGASGFIGRKMVKRLLAEGMHVTVLVRTSELADGFVGPRCDAHIGDLMIPSTLKYISVGIDQVIHLAANASLQARSEAEFSVNVDGTRNLLGALDGSPALGRFILMSSITAAAREPGSRLSNPVNAASDATPDTPYGRSKRDAEKLVIQTYGDTSVEWVIIRPALVYGPGSKTGGGMNAIVELAKRPGLVGRLDFPGQISVIHVDDLVDVCLLATRSEAAVGRTIFATDGEPVTFGQIIRTASGILGRSRTQVPVSLISNIVRTIYDAFDANMGISKWIPSYLLAPLGFSLACESSDLHSLGYSPRYSLRSGLIQTLEKCK